MGSNFRGDDSTAILASFIVIVAGLLSCILIAVTGDSPRTAIVAVVISFACIAALPILPFLGRRHAADPKLRNPSPTLRERLKAARKRRRRERLQQESERMVWKRKTSAPSGPSTFRPE